MKNLSNNYIRIGFQKIIKNGWEVRTWVEVRTWEEVRTWVATRKGGLTNRHLKTPRRTNQLQIKTELRINKMMMEISSVC